MVVFVLKNDVLLSNISKVTLLFIVALLSKWIFVLKMLNVAEVLQESKHQKKEKATFLLF
jgi:hypothetical protein